MSATVRLFALVGLLLACAPATAGHPVVTRQIAVPDPSQAHREEAEGTARPHCVRSTVGGRVAVHMILPTGTSVVKDQLVCELDDSMLRVRLRDQVLATNRALGERSAAELGLAVAEIDLKEYEESVYPHQLRQIEQAIVVGKAMVALAEESLKAARRRSSEEPDEADLTASFTRMGSDDQDGDHPDGRDVSVEVLRARFLFEMAQLELRQVELRHELLVGYAGPRRRTELQAAIERAQGEIQSKNLALELAEGREEQARRNVERCKVYAPADGIIEYQERQIGLDAVVRRGALLFVLHPDQTVGADGLTPGTGGSDRPLAEFLARELGVRILADGRPTDEEVEVLSRKATDALGRPVTAADIDWFLDRLDRLRRPRPERHEGLDRP